MIHILYSFYVCSFYYSFCKVSDSQVPMYKNHWLSAFTDLPMIQQIYQNMIEKTRKARRISKYDTNNR